MNTETAEAESTKQTPLVRAEGAMAAIRILSEKSDGSTGVTADDRQTLLSWPGWGALSPAFAVDARGRWLAIAEELETLIGEDAMTAAAAQVDTSFYTPQPLVDAVFEILIAAGFTGGSVLEPGCGSGRFMDRAPRALDIQWTGVEIDPVSASIARLLNPEANIVTAGLEKTAFPSGSFDAVIGNVPFSSSTVYDSEFESSSLHEYFLLRAIDAVRPGGYVAILTSRYSMDSEYGLSRALAPARDAELIGAIRLPSGAFADEGTDVVSDLLIIRKLDQGEIRSGWDNASRNRPGMRMRVEEPADPAVSGVPTDVNSYWAAHPDHVVGVMKVTSFFRNPLVVVSTDPGAGLRVAIESVKPRLVAQSAVTDIAAELADVPLFDIGGRKEGSFHVVDDMVMEVIGARLTPVRNTAEIRSLIELRDAGTALLSLEADADLPDSAIDPLRTQTKALYLAYVTAFGALNRGALSEGKKDPDTGLPTYAWRRPAMGGFRRDPDYATVIALEEFDQDDGTSSPASILNGRVNRKPQPVQHVDTPAEALAVSLGETRRIDLARIAGLLDLESDNEALSALGELVYTVDGVLIAARDFLSGNVREKLAKSQGDATPNGVRNTKALAAAMPADLGPLEIRATLGAPWISGEYVTEFTREVLGSSVTVTHTPEVAVWEIDNIKWARATAEATLSFGTSRCTPFQLLDWSLNGKAAVVFDEVWEGNKLLKVRNVSQSLAAAEKMRALDDRFSTWVWEDGARAETLVTEYNRRFNSHVTRTADGSGLIFPGLSASTTPWAHQRNAVDRIVSSERVLIGHPVGAGKTLSMLLGALTLRRFGLAQKPMIVIPNHLLDQIVREAQQAYPTARFLIASREDLARDRRRVFAARCATGDWDAVIITHQAFTSLPVSPAAEAKWIESEKAGLRTALQGQSPYSRARGPKAIARALRALDTRLAGLRHGVEDAEQILFEHLGVDYLMVDEAHLFRRLSTGSTSRDSGFGAASSKRATDMLLKIETLAGRHPGKPIVSMFTGTPWANTLAETWVWQRYLQPDALSEAGVREFEPWVATFVRYENAVEVAPDGSGFRIQRRPAGMKNLPELRTMLGRVADIVRADDIGLERPDHTLHNIVVDAAPQQLDFVRALAARADRIRGAGRAQRPDGPGDDSMLLVCNDGRKVALDPLLVGIEEQSPKVAEVARQLARSYRENAHITYGDSPVPGAFHLALLDLGTPHPGDTAVYGRLRQLLVSHGVPAEKIRWIHEAKTDKARAALFAQCREGGVSILMGSTAKVGIGTNIQTRLKTLWHIDAPWTPAEVEQREGRALRPKNLNAHVDIFRCVTESTFDAYSWQALERKARGFAALYDITSAVREVDDIAGQALSYGEVKALAAGNPMLLEQATTAATVQRLRLMRSVHLQGVNRARKEAISQTDLAASLDDKATALESYVEKFADEDKTVVPAIAALSGIIAARERIGYLRPVYRGITVRETASQQPKRGWVYLSFDHGYRIVGDMVVQAKLISRGAVSIAEEIVRAVDAWADNAAGRAVSMRARAAEARVLAHAAEVAADSVVFAEEAELERAIAALARIDSILTTEAEEHHKIAA